MRNPNMNKSLRHVRGLVVLVCILFLILIMGTAEARYRAEKNATIQFQLSEPAQIYLGTLSKAETETEEETVEEGIFDPEGILTWTEAEGIYSMELAVANGSSEEVFYAKDQQFRLQLVGSLGLGTEAAFPKIELRVHSKENPETYETFQATASRIKEGTTLYHSVGSGWIIQFQNENGQEPVWTLGGGSLSYAWFTITVENVVTDSDIMLQPKVEANVIQE